MMESKRDIGKWKEALKRKAEVAFVNGSKNDDAFIKLLLKSQDRRTGKGK